MTLAEDIIEGIEWLLLSGLGVFAFVALPLFLLSDIPQQLRNKKWMKKMKEEERRLKDLSGEDEDGPAGGDGANWKGKHGCGGGSL